MANQFGKSYPVTLLRACATRRIDCVYPRPSFRARHACYAGCVEAGDISKESVQEIIESIRLLFTLENDDLGAVSAKERSCAAPILKVGRHISDTRFLYHSFPQCEQVFTIQMSRIELQ